MNSPSYQGGAKEDRTPDLLHAMQALSQLSYSPGIKEKSVRYYLPHNKFRKNGADPLHAMSRCFLNPFVEIGIPTTLINHQNTSGQALSPDTPLRIGRDPDRVFKRVSGPAALVFLNNYLEETRAVLDSSKIFKEIKY